MPWLYLGNIQVSVYRTIGPTLVDFFLGGGDRTILAFLKSIKIRTLVQETLLFYLL